MKQRIELLAPAKDLVCAMEAVNHGADAVYMGAVRFGARAAAGNTTQDVEKAVSYAHRYGASVYVTLNTLLYDHELADAVNLTRELYQSGVDALIIQDIRLLYLRQQHVLPPVPIHASTQMDNATLEKVLFLEKEGFDRVVLAREMGLDEIRNIRKNTTVALECFIHGALCVSYSGKCYISQVDCGRSANRGDCAQYCRLSYDLEDAQGKVLVKNKHLLSLKDMDRSDVLPQLLDMGMNSLKIEGRLKGVDYVKNITAHYRRKLDALGGQKTSLGSCTFFFTPDPRKTFHRDRTEYLPVKGRFTEEVHQWNTPKSTGELLGKPIRVFRDGFQINAGISTGDGLCFTLPDGTFTGFAVNRIEENSIFQRGLSLTTDTEIYRNYDRQFDKILKGKTAERKMDLDVILREIPGGNGFDLTLVREALPGTEPMRVTVPVQATRQEAEDPIQGREYLEKSFSRMGNTPFCIRNIFFEPKDFSFFIPVSAIVAARRNALALLDEKSRQDLPAGRMTGVQDLSGEDPLKILENAYPGKKFHTAATPLSEDTPLMTCRYCLKQAMGYCSPEPLYLVRGKKKFPVYFDCQACLMFVGNAVSSKRESPHARKK
ncbi:MAG: U32 family peptidase [Bacteroidales bacterium]